MSADQATNEIILEAVKNLTLQVRSLDSHLKNEVDEIKESQSFISGNFEELKNEIKGVVGDVKTLKTKVKSLEESVTVLDQKLKEKDAAIDNLEQYGRRDCIEISGIPMLPGEDTKQIMLDIAVKLDVQLQLDEISTSHRLPQNRRGDSPKIIVKFVRREKRDEIYNSRKQIGGTSDLQSSQHYSRSKIFINESLTARRRQLFHDCLQFKKEKGYKYLWTRNGKILLKPSDMSEVFTIESEKDFEKVKNKLKR